MGTCHRRISHCHSWRTYPIDLIPRKTRSSLPTKIFNSLGDPIALSHALYNYFLAFANRAERAIVNKLLCEKRETNSEANQKRPKKKKVV